MTLALGPRDKGDTIGGFITYAVDWLPAGLASAARAEFMARPPAAWDVHTFKMGGKMREGRRRSLWIYGDEPGFPRRAGSYGWDLFPVLGPLRAASEALAGVAFNAALVHLYARDEHYLSYHCDESENEVYDAAGQVVASISFGKARRFQVAWSAASSALAEHGASAAPGRSAVLNFDLEEGAVVVMSGSMNLGRGGAGWKHGG